MSPMKPAPETASIYWRSINELARTPEFQEAVAREFPGEDWDALPPATRRSFLKVMGASLAFAGLTACRWPEEEIVPFAHRPEGRTPGEAQHFASAIDVGGSALGLLVTSVDGRPIKAEGNPQHPDSLGALSAAAQANILELYDPDRSRGLLMRRNGEEYNKSWEDFETAAAELFAGSGEGVAVLSEASSSPTGAGLRERLQAKLPASRWYEYEPVSRDHERLGARMAFGRDLRALPNLGAARVVVCLDADPLFEHPAALRLARDFAASRRPDPQTMSRLYVAESSHTMTGARADHRLAVNAGQTAAVLAAVVRRLQEAHGLSLPPQALGLAQRIGAINAVADTKFVQLVAADLADHRGDALLLAGPRQEPAVHALVAVLNQALGNTGHTLGYALEPDSGRPSHVEAMVELADRMRSGEIQTLLILGGNPAYNAPSDLGFAKLLAEVPRSIHLSLYDDETSRLCTWHLPRAHNLEAWGDGRAWDGTLTMQQPLIEPLYGGRSTLDLLALVLGEASTRGYDLVRENTRQADGAVDFEKYWRRLLHDGVDGESAWEPVQPALDASGLARAATDLGEVLGWEAPSAQRPELVLVPDARVFDGRWANNGWLQELPDAVTKLTWDNALLMSPATARELNLAEGELVMIGSATSSVELPVSVLPGMARFTFVAALGYGRSAAGSVGNGVGGNTYTIRTSDRLHLFRGVSLRVTGKSRQLATTQDHHAIDAIGFAARNQRIGGLVREASVDAYLADPEVIHHHSHHPPLVSLWKDTEYKGEQWGMAIDLDACIGCNACVVACQAENNIPVIGRQQVINQREMHWIRLDRYFKTEPGLGPDEVDDAEMVFQPMTCVHCENAPCEQVCPVAATQHTEDGLNSMVYNRCIGTRYCANNCPFKVRRFNFFNFHKDLPQVAKMQHNPEVTVRSRGVMEKCTFCVQRIDKVRIAARNDNRPIKDGEVIPACAQTCPTKAIIFGNLKDADSEISKSREDSRSYATLAELNIRPRAHYLARLRNPADGGESGGDHYHEDDAHGKES